MIDADELAKQALDDPKVQDELTRWWGSNVIGTDGKVDRKAVGHIVFDNPDQLRWLEELVHPLVHASRDQLRHQYLKDDQIVAIVEDCPLLIEKGLDSQCDTTIFVNTSRETRLQRLAQTRGWSEKELAQREKNQSGLDIKAKTADHIIDNNAGIEECFSNVRRVLSQIFQG